MSEERDDCGATDEEYCRDEARRKRRALLDGYDSDDSWANEDEESFNRGGGDDDSDDQRNASVFSEESLTLDNHGHYPGNEEYLLENQGARPHETVNILARKNKVPEYVEESSEEEEEEDYSTGAQMDKMKGMGKKLGVSMMMVCVQPSLFFSEIKYFIPFHANLYPPLPLPDRPAFQQGPRDD